MECLDKCTCDSCISDIIKKILVLQKLDYDNSCYSGCDKPFLGPINNSVCYNTRPVLLYNRYTANPYTFYYTIDGTANTTNVLRVESCDDCCVTCRLLYLNPSTNEYEGTREFVTIDLESCGAIKCLNDTYIDLC